MNSTTLEARLIGLTHRSGCAGERVEVYDAARPGPTIRGSRGGPTRAGPPTPLRVARCQECAATAVREIGQRERLAAIAAEIDAKEAALDRARAGG